MSSAATQGVSVATGLQKQFSWTSVAIGGVVGGAVGVAGRGLAGYGIGMSPRADMYANQALSGMAGALAGAGAKSLIDGTSFGDNVIAALPDVIGATIGNMLGDSARGIGRGRSFDKVVSTSSKGAGGTSVEAATAQPSNNTQSDITFRDPTLTETLASPFLTMADKGRIAFVAGLKDDWQSDITGRQNQIKQGYLNTIKAQSKEAARKADQAFIDEGGIIVTGKRNKTFLAQDVFRQGQQRDSISASQVRGWLQDYINDYSPKLKAANTATNKAEYNRETGQYKAYIKQIEGWDAAANAQIDRELGGFLGVSVLAAGSFVFTPVLIESGSSWLTANTALGATSAKLVSGGAIGLSYTEAGTRIFQGRAPTWGERIAGTVTGGLFGSGLLGLKTGKPILDGVVNGWLSGGVQSLGGQSIDQKLGSGKPIDWTVVGINSVIGLIAGGVGGKVSPYYSRTPSLGNSQSFGAGWNYGIRTQVNTAPATAVSIMVQAHGDAITGDALNPKPIPRPRFK